MNLRYLPQGTLEALRQKHPQAYTFLLVATLAGELQSIERDIAIYERFPMAADRVEKLRQRAEELRLLINPEAKAA